MPKRKQAPPAAPIEVEEEEELQEEEEGEFDSEEERGEGGMVEDSDDDSSDDDDEDDEIKFEGELEGEAEEVDIVFDDPQERHAGSLRVLLRQSSLCASLGVAASDGLAALAAADPESVGTVAANGEDYDDEDYELYGFAAVVRLGRYTKKKQEVGVETAKKAIGGALPDAASAALITHGRYVNTPPRVIAETFRQLREDVRKAPFTVDKYVAIVTASSSSSSTPEEAAASDSSSGGAKKTKKQKKQQKKTLAKVECDTLEDDCLAKHAEEAASLGKKGLHAVLLSQSAFSAAVDEMIKLTAAVETAPTPTATTTKGKKKNKK